MTLVDGFRALVTVLSHGPAESKVTVILFIIVIAVALLFEGLWLHARNHIFRLENKDTTHQATPTAIAILIANISAATLGLLGKLFSKPSSISCKSTSSSHRERRPTKIATTHLSASPPRFTSPDTNIESDVGQSHDTRR